MTAALVRSGSQLPEQFNAEQVDLIKQQVMPGASHGELSLFMATCQRLQLDPFAKQIYAIKRRTQDDNYNWVEKWQTQTSIDGFRVVANRSAEYEGQVGPHWCGEDEVWKEVWLSDRPPLAARVGVWRKGFREPTWGVARLTSYAQLKKDGSPTKMWKAMPDVMLAKCAEALALRKAFPNDLSGLYTRDEMGQVDNDAVDVVAEPVVEVPPVSHRDPPHVPAQPREANFPVAEEKDEQPAGVDWETFHAAINAIPGLAGEDKETRVRRKVVYAEILMVDRPAARWNPRDTWVRMAPFERSVALEKAYARQTEVVPDWGQTATQTTDGGPDAPGAEKE